MREGSHLQARTPVSEMLLLPWGAAGRLEVGRLVHRKTSPVGLAILPTRQSEQRGTRFTSLLGSFGVLKFWAELLFLGLFQACCRGLQCRWARFCVSSWSQLPHEWPRRTHRAPAGCVRQLHLPAKCSPEDPWPKKMAPKSARASTWIVVLYT